MTGIDFIVTVGAHQEKVPDVGAGEERSQQTQCGRVGPLQVVEEHDQGMLGLRDRRDKLLKHELESVERLRRR